MIEAAVDADVEEVEIEETSEEEEETVETDVEETETETAQPDVEEVMVPLVRPPLPPSEQELKNCCIPDNFDRACFPWA